MAYRELGMVEVREVLRRWMAGEGLRAIARSTGVDRKTVAEYVRVATAFGLRRGGELPTDEQLAAVLAVRRPGRPATAEAPSPENAALAPYRDRIQRWLTVDALRLTKIHRRLRAEGVSVSYSTLYRFARAQCAFRPAAVTVRVADPPPGEVAEADFGLLGLWTDPATARRQRVWGLLITLGYRRYAFLAVSVRQDLAAMLDGLEAAWAFFAGVVRRLVIDNLKPAVHRADRYSPRLARVFLEYAQYRGVVVDPTVVRHPTGKAYASYCTSLVGCGADLLRRAQAESPFHL